MLNVEKCTSRDESNLIGEALPYGREGKLVHHGGGVVAATFISFS